MLYQKLLIGDKPYFLSVKSADPFEVHRHSEMELSYCLHGTYDIVCENRRYTLTEGDFAFILPLAAHELPEGNDPSCCCVTMELGYSLLGNHWKAFTVPHSKCLCYRKCDMQHSPIYKQLADTIRETVTLHQSDSLFDELLIKGNLYKVSGLLLQLFQSTQAIDVQSKKTIDIKKIDQALEIIYNRYYESLTVESVSALCGYSKSNFCKIFKALTGDTFHNTLNRHRIEIACLLLQGSNDSIEKIAQAIGFSDIKSFCRVFKKTIGMNAGEFRKTRGTTTR